MRFPGMLVPVLVLVACSEAPEAPPSPIAPTAGDYPALVAWFAERGIEAPDEPPAPAAAAKVALDFQPLLGDIDDSRQVDIWDVWVLWDYLTRGIRPRGLDEDLLDIDRDYDRDWRDLMLIGQFAFERGDTDPNPYGIGLEVTYGVFDIELVFVDGHQFTPDQMQLMQDAARRWEQIIVADIPDKDYGFRWRLHLPWADAHQDGEYIHFDNPVDDLQVYVTTRDGYTSSGSVTLVRRPDLGDPGPAVPVVSMVAIAESRLAGPESSLFDVMIHELGHALGIGSQLWVERELLGNSAAENPDADTYFSGSKARELFDLAGGWSYSGMKVPVENGERPGSRDGHWRESVMGSEIMTPMLTEGGFNPVSAITIQSLADLGYRVDISRADPYSLSPEALSKPVGTSEIFCDGPH